MLSPPLLHHFPGPQTPRKGTIPNCWNLIFKPTLTFFHFHACILSPSFFCRIWKKYFQKNYVKACQHDSLRQLCEIGHKIEKNCENFVEITEAEKKKLQMKKNVVLHHKLINKETKKQFQHLIDNLKEGQGILTIDFKENITLGRGPRELQQS
jgi:hypothetical protein